MIEKKYDQSDIPLRELTTADGHSVRALYLYSAMADMAKTDSDKELYDACLRLYDNIVSKRMYITGGVGSTHIGEAFTLDYALPNRTAYNETCASIAMTLFARRMHALSPESRYADIIEREIYNGALSGWSQDGEKFFYENPLEIDPYLAGANVSTKQKERLPIMERQKVFNCSCCPPNMVRFISSIADYMYSENADTLFVNQYAESETELEKGTVSQSTSYPANGEITIRLSAGYKNIALRIPGWCSAFTLNKPYTMKNGYAYIAADGEDEIRLSIEMSPRILCSNPKLQENAGRVAVSYGPIVYCAESVDNGKFLKAIRISSDTRFTVCEGSEFGLPLLKSTVKKLKPQTELYYELDNAAEDFELTLIPYCCFANRGVAEMLVWLVQG